MTLYVNLAELLGTRIDKASTVPVIACLRCAP